MYQGLNTGDFVTKSEKETRISTSKLASVIHCAGVRNFHGLFYVLEAFRGNQPDRLCSLLPSFFLLSPST